MTLNSTTSKPSTESDTATKKSSRWFRLGGPVVETPDLDGLFDFYWGGPERRITGLTLRIIGVNAAALIMLAVGILYLGQYQNGLIEAKLDTFSAEVELVAAALSETVPNTHSPDETARLIKRLSQSMEQRIYLFNAAGNLVVDSDKVSQLNEPGPAFESEPERKTYYTVEVLKKMTSFVLQFVPDRRYLPPYPETKSEKAVDYPDAADAIKGTTSLSAWHDVNNHVFLTAASPLQKNGQMIGAILLTRNGRDIEEDTSDVWVNIIKAFSITLMITIVLSIYLSGTIASPLRELARAAESLRRGTSKDTAIPDFSSRRDEIGELSIVMREMTQALWDRIDSIERFAADVAHELKNPLTSLKSAVETAAIVKTDKDRKKLMEIISHDIERMDRLISDISTASRLDAELSREELEKVNIKTALEGLIDLHRAPLQRGSGAKAKTSSNVNIMLHDMGDGKHFVWGLEMRLAQVFENLISNAISFSPVGGAVHITIVPVKKRVVVTVEDEGPGIPENRLETIFERFYTERPQHEDYGKHSGLGLSICKQIISALGGQIFAENIKDPALRVTGARFTVILSKVA